MDNQMYIILALLTVIILYIIIRKAMLAFKTNMAFPPYWAHVWGSHKMQSEGHPLITEYEFHDFEKLFNILYFAKIPEHPYSLFQSASKRIKDYDEGELVLDSTQIHAGIVMFDQVCIQFTNKDYLKFQSWLKATLESIPFTPQEEINSILNDHIISKLKK